MMNQTDPPTRAPPPFPEPMIESCVRINTNVCDRTGTVRFYRDRVLVKRRVSALFSRAGRFAGDGEDMDESISSSNSSCSSIHNSEVRYEEKGVDDRSEENEPAYLICDEIHNAIYGKVYHGIVLHRSNPGGVWEMTLEECAIKEMDWERIINGRDRLSENPQDEIAAMQHVVRCLAGTRGTEMSALDTMRESKVIVPLDYIYDDSYLYTITPFCTGGEMFALLENERRLSEEQSRYLFRSMLDGLESLQKVGLCHRDISLENILVDQEKTIIIDMGMCVRIPFLNDEEDDANTPRNVDHRDRSEQRCLISRQPRCGKMFYMSPEVYRETSFDGHAVDMWAMGVCLFMILTGSNPWNVPAAHDNAFRCMSIQGYLRRVIEHWNIPLSGHAMDLLQQMLRQNPRDRLNLQQVRDHPWMDGPESNPMDH